MNKIIIVTGASKGIGREIAKQLAIKGNTIIANYNKSEKEILELKKELEEKNIKIEIFKADVSKREEASKLVDYAIEKYKKIAYNSYIEYDYDEQRGTTSEINEYGKALILPYTPIEVRRKIQK